MNWCWCEWYGWGMICMCSFEDGWISCDGWDTRWIRWSLCLWEGCLCCCWLIIEIFLLEICMICLVGWVCCVWMRLWRCWSRVGRSAWGWRLRRGRIIVSYCICDRCCCMGVCDWKLVCRVFMKMLCVILIVGILWWWCKSVLN